MTAELPSRRTALAGAGLLTWLLAFPFYGPLLEVWQPGFSGVLAAHFFSLSHAGALAALAWTPLPARRLQQAAWLLLPLTLSLWLTPAGPLGWAGMVLAAALAAAAILAWLQAVAQAPRPAPPFAAAVTASNLVLWALTWPGAPVIPRPLAAALATLPLLGLRALPVTERATENPTAPLAVSNTALQGSVGSWLFFAAVAYTTGGLMYRGLIPVAAAHPLLPWLGTGPYLFGLWAGLGLARGGGPASLVGWTLATLGAGFALVASSSVFPPSFVLAWTLVQAGLGLADACLWLYAISLVRCGHRSLAGLLLGLSVAAITSTGILADGLQAGQWARLPVVSTLGSLALLALVPALARLTASDGDSIEASAPQPAARMPQPTHIPPVGTEEPEALAEPHSPAVSPEPTGNALTRLPPDADPVPAQPQPAQPIPLEDLARQRRLTRTEREVLQLLLAGASDADLVAHLGTTRNTIKIHVRNILRKLECRNRKELVARWAPLVITRARNGSLNS